MAAVSPSTQDASHLCKHCGLEVPRFRWESDFCCTGCDAVYRTLSGLGLQDFYRYRDFSKRSPQPASPSNSSYGYLDDEAACSRLNGQAELRNASLYLEGIHCAGCVWLIEKLPSLLSGVLRATVDFSSSEVTLVFDPARAPLSSIARMLDSFGYRVHLLDGLDRDKVERRERRIFLWRLGVGAFVWGNVMMLAVSLYQGMVTGIEQPYADYFRWMCLLLSLPAVTFCAWPFYRTSIAALRAGSLHIDVPISLGILVAFAFSAFNTVFGRSEVYFDSVTGLIFLLLCGRWMQSSAMKRAQRLSQRSFALLPATARVLSGTKGDQTPEEVPARFVPAGSLVEVMSGERLPVDGVVVEGQSLIDRSVLTGESIPLRAEVESEAFAGTLNLESRIIIRASGGAGTSRVGRLIARVKDGSARAPIVLVTDRLSHAFVLTVLGLALLTCLVWSKEGLTTGITNAVALLVITCPCALGLATPIAMTVALGKAAARGILIKGEDAVERLARAKVLFFDKTGTLTEGALSVMDSWSVLDSKEFQNQITSLASVSSSHPLSQSLLRHFAVQPTAGTGTLVPGRGVSGPNHDWRLGSERWLAETIVDWPAEARNKLTGWHLQGFTVLLLVQERHIRGMVALCDSLRDEAPTVISKLVEGGRRCFILSGDSNDRVARVAESLNIEGQGDLYPEEKEAWVRNEKEFTGVIGDGFNDAPAMRSAGVSIGIRGGLEANIEAADVFVGAGGMSGVLDTIQGAKETMSVIRRNLIISFVYNIAGGLAAMAGLVNPLVAAVVMPISSLSVIWSSIHSKAFAEPSWK